MDTLTPSKNSRRREHALHNEEVCSYLAERSEFGDWVITTAFYSALHWMNYKLFPFSIPNDKGRKELYFGTLDDYSAEVHGNLKPVQSKHRTLLNLVRDMCPKDISSEYRRLFEMCIAARYRDYRTNPRIISVVQNSLKTIRTYCEK